GHCQRHHGASLGHTRDISIRSLWLAGQPAGDAERKKPSRGQRRRLLMLIQDILAAKRDGQALDEAAIRHFIQAVAENKAGDEQIGAFTMATAIHGMSLAETVALTSATRDSGRVMDYSALNLAGPVLDKHSTGGVGDPVSLILGPWLAACGAHVPMISGRGLGHTG